MIKSVIPCFNFPFFARVVLCGVTHILQSEPDFQFIMCCAREEEENVRIFVPLSVLFLRKRSFWSFFTGPGRLQVSALGLELRCALSSYSKVAARHHCSRRALYSQCTVYQPKLWPVKSWLTPNFFGSSCVERQLLCQNWFWAMCRLFQLLKGKGGGTSVDKAVKLIWLVFGY